MTNAQGVMIVSEGMVSNCNETGKEAKRWAGGRTVKSTEGHIRTVLGFRVK